MANNFDAPSAYGNHASMARHSHGYTDFNAHSHQELYAMLFASDPATVREAAAAWQSTGRMLADQAAQLKHQLVGFSQMWQGQAADEYKVMITDLASGLEKVGDSALAMNNLMTSSAESVETARAEMPAPSSVPDLDPQTMAAATAAPSPEVVMNPAASAQFQQNQLQAQQAVQAHQTQVAAAQASQAKAVQVMQTLATSYSGDEDQVPAAPESVSSGPTGVPASTDGVIPIAVGGAAGMQSLPSMGGPAAIMPGTDGLIGSTGTAPSASIPSSPLFGHMFTAGLAAASAAASGRFGSVMPKLPSFLNPQTKQAKQTSAEAAAAAARAAAARAAAAKLPSGLAGSGMGGGGFGGGGIGAGSAAAPSAYPGLIGGGGAAGVAAGSLAGQAASAAGAAGSPGASGMPMMPMGAMGAGAGGDMGGRRIPPWLVETEDVWGESSAVSPPVIGEDL